MDWLMDFLSPRAVLVVWVDAQKPAANESLRTSVTKRSFVIVRGAVHECGCAPFGRGDRRTIRSKRRRSAPSDYRIASE